MDKNKILELLGQFFVEQNIDIIRPYLHSNIVYSTDGLVGEVTENTGYYSKVHDGILGTRNFISHFKNKFYARVNPLEITDYYTYPIHYKGTHFVLLKGGTNKKKIILVVVKFKEGQLHNIHLRMHNGCYEYNRARQEELNKRMFKAAARLHMKTVHYCLRKGANKNATNEDGETVLTVVSYACKMDYKALGLPVCLQDISDPNVKERMLSLRKQFTSLGYEFNDAMACFVLNTFTEKIGFRTSGVKVLDMMRLIEKGCDVNKYIEKSYPNEAKNALYYAVAFREMDLVEFLLANGARVDIKYPPFRLWDVVEMAEADLKRMQNYDPYNKTEIRKMEVILERLQKARDAQNMPGKSPEPNGHLEN